MGHVENLDLEFSKDIESSSEFSHKCYFSEEFKMKIILEDIKKIIIG